MSSITTLPVVWLRILLLSLLIFISIDTIKGLFKIVEYTMDIYIIFITFF
jgi:hypothetical protein